jgi:hypothetical protein
MSSRYVLPLQNDKNIEGTMHRWHGGTPLRALGQNYMHTMKVYGNSIV